MCVKIHLVLLLFIVIAKDVEGNVRDHENEVAKLKTVVSKLEANLENVTRVLHEELKNVEELRNSFKAEIDDIQQTFLTFNKYYGNFAVTIAEVEKKSRKELDAAKNQQQRINSRVSKLEKDIDITKSKQQESNSDYLILKKEITNLHELRAQHQRTVESFSGFDNELLNCKAAQRKTTSDILQLKEEMRELQMLREQPHTTDASLPEREREFQIYNTTQQQTTSDSPHLNDDSNSDILQLKEEIQLLRERHQRTEASFSVFKIEIQNCTAGQQSILSDIVKLRTDSENCKNEHNKLSVLEKKLQNSTEVLTNGIQFSELENKIVSIEARLSSPLIESPPFQNGKVYFHSKLADEKKGDWFKNKMICQKYNLEMVSIHSAEENEYFHNWARGSDVRMVHPGAWLAAQTHNHDVNFTWNNVGVIRNYTNLSPYKFNEPFTNCLILGWTNGLTWDDWYCNRELFIVCQKRQ